MRLLNSIEEQVHTKEIARKRSKGDELRQRSPTAASYFKNAKCVKSDKTVIVQGVQDGALTPLDGKEMGAIEKRINVAPSEAPVSIGIFESQARKIIRRVQW
jgi:hypothetical protein